MTTLADKALLPAGTSDMLSPNAQYEADKVRDLLAVFSLRGYARVKPPMLEFEDSLLAIGGAATASQTYRLMDPESHKMMGLRPDMTPQVARIATTRLAKAPRPLRLSYAGEVVRVRGSQLRPKRQFHQVGVEMLGSDSAAADGEVIVMAVEALNAIGVENLSVDLGVPTLIPVLAEELGLSRDDARDLRDVLDRKDAAGVHALGARLGDDKAALFSALLRASGPAADARAQLADVALPPKARAVWDGLLAVLDHLTNDAPTLTITADAVENRGFEYHTGVTFTLFAKRVRGELGSGGRYHASGETATGFTLFMDSILRALPAPTATDRVFVPAGEDGSALRSEGRITVQGLDATADAMAEAKRLTCTHLLIGGAVRPVDT